MEYRYKTRGVCSSEILLELDGDVVKSAKFTGGCNGNLKGICSLIAGMKVDDVIARCKGIRCGFKPTSCPDQLSKALELLLNADIAQKRGEGDLSDLLEVAILRICAM